MSARIMPPHLVHLVWCRIKTFHFHVGHTLHLTPIRASLLVTTLVMSWKSYVMLEQRAYLPPKARSEVSVLFHAVSLRDLPRCHICFLDLLLFCCLAQSMQTPLYSGKQCLTVEATVTPLLPPLARLYSPDPGESRICRHSHGIIP